MTTTPRTISPPTPKNVQVNNVPDDVAQLLHRLAYETGRTKRDLIIDAVRAAYGDNK